MVLQENNDIKEYSKRISKYVFDKVVEASSLKFNNFSKRYKSFASTVGKDNNTNKN